MGWYITCQICGTEGKYGYDCNCPYEQSLKISRMRIGMTLVESTPIYFHGIGNVWNLDKYVDGKGGVLFVKNNLAMYHELGTFVPYEMMDEESFTKASAEAEILALREMQEIQEIRELLEM